jgi:hypothetical protein
MTIWEELFMRGLCIPLHIVGSSIRYWRTGNLMYKTRGAVPVQYVTVQGLRFVAASIPDVVENSESARILP